MVYREPIKSDEEYSGYPFITAADAYLWHIKSQQRPGYKKAPLTQGESK